MTMKKPVVIGISCAVLTAASLAAQAPAVATPTGRSNLFARIAQKDLCQAVLPEGEGRMRQRLRFNKNLTPADDAFGPKGFNLLLVEPFSQQLFMLA